MKSAVSAFKMLGFKISTVDIDRDERKFSDERKSSGHLIKKKKKKTWYHSVDDKLPNFKIQFQYGNKHSQ